MIITGYPSIENTVHKRMRGPQRLSRGAIVLATVSTPVRSEANRFQREDSFATLLVVGDQRSDNVPT